MAEGWVDRLRTERDELSARLTKLEDFLHCREFRFLAPVDQSLLREQLVAMRDYHSVLSHRLRRAEFGP